MFSRTGSPAPSPVADYSLFAVAAVGMDLVV